MQSLGEHLVLADDAEAAREPRQFVAKRPVCFGIEQGGKRAQVRTEFACGHTQCVHGFGVVAEPHPGIVTNHLHKAGCDGVPYEASGARMGTVKRFDHYVGFGAGPWTERSYQFGQRRVANGASVKQ